VTSLGDSRFTLMGWGTGYGEFRIDDLLVPAFGPQSLPFSDLSQFGIAQKLAAEPVLREDVISLVGWSCCYAERAAWIHMNASASSKWVRLLFKAIGHQKVHIVFYVQASSCSVLGGPLLHPGELKNYSGVPHQIILNKNVKLLSKERCSIIPLSGTEHFWNATFLIAFEFAKKRGLFDSLCIEFSC
jgi:hypothetical protein